MHWNARLFQELIISMLLGSVPVFLGYFLGGAELLLTVIKAVMPESYYIFYSFALTAIYFLVSFADRFFLKRTDRQRQTMRFLTSTWREIGSGLISLWRVLCGAILAIPILWLVVEPETIRFGKFFGALLLSAALLIECVWLSLGASYLDRRS